MPTYDDDLPSSHEQILLKQLEETSDFQQRLTNIIELKNCLVGSKRSKNVFYRSAAIELIFKLLQEYSTSNKNEILIELIDCISSFTKSTNREIVHRLIELGCIEILFKILFSHENSIELCESSLRCLRSFFLRNLSDQVLQKIDYSNPFLVPVPFVLLCDQENQQVYSSITDEDHQQEIDMESTSPVKILFNQNDFLDLLVRFLSTTKTIQIIVIEIFCSLCIDNERQEKLYDRNISPSIIEILVENIHEKLSQSTNFDRINLVNLTNDCLISLSLKLFSSLCYENPTIGQRLNQLIHVETNRNLIEIVSSLLTKTYRPTIVSYYAAKFFVNLCKCKVLAPDHQSVGLEALSTLIHLCSKSVLTKCLYLNIECLETLIYLLNGNSLLHHLTIYNEQFLNRLFVYFFTPTKIVDESVDETIIVQIRASALTLLAVLSSHHEDIKKRIAEHENFISKTIECCRSTNSTLKIAGFRLFHGLSRSVSQLRTTFNDTICDVLLEAIQSSDMSLVKISSCVISNVVLEFSTCRPRLLNGGILNIILGFLSHKDHDLRINSIWALRNLSYLASLKIKQEIIHGLTVDRIYQILDNCPDEQFLLCLLSLLRNLFDEKDTETLLTIFHSVRLLTALQKIFDRKPADKIRQELTTLIDHLNNTINPAQQRLNTEPVNSTCRTSLFPEYACEEMDQLDCS